MFIETFNEEEAEYYFRANNDNTLQQWYEYEKELRDNEDEYINDTVPEEYRKHFDYVITNEKVIEFITSRDDRYWNSNKVYQPVVKNGFFNPDSLVEQKNLTYSGTCSGGGVVIELFSTYDGSDEVVKTGYNTTWAKNHIFAYNDNKNRMTSIPYDMVPSEYIDYCMKKYNYPIHETTLKGGEGKNKWTDKVWYIKMPMKHILRPKLPALSLEDLYEHRKDIDEVIEFKENILSEETRKNRLKDLDCLKKKH